MNSPKALNARHAALAGLSLALLVAMTSPVVAMDRGDYSIEVLVDGTLLTEYAARATTYVEAIEGREYSIRLRNNTAQRVAIALSVDGMNTIDAKTTSARKASKWILGPRQTITLDGWQTDASTARRFFFTTEKESYGAWLGKTRNLGVISAAVFRERQPRPTPIWNREDKSERRRQSREDSSADAPSSESRRVGAVEPEASDDFAATGIGQKIGHDVRRVRFDTESSPAALLEIRYEYRDALVRLGVLRLPRRPCDDPLSRRERARGFDGMEFAPDPYDPACP